MIWEEVLPDVGPCLFPYRRGCWTHVKVPPDDEEDGDYVEWVADELGHLQIALPIATVNREARSAALAWARRNGLTMQLPASPGQNPPVAVAVAIRKFDPARDTVFVPSHEWHRFLNEPQAVAGSVSEFFDLPVSSQFSLTRLAITKSTLRRSGGDWIGVYDYFDIKDLFILSVDDAWIEVPGWWGRMY